MEYIVSIDGKDLPIRFTTLNWAMKTRRDLKGFERYAQSDIKVRSVYDAGTTQDGVARRADVLLGGSPGAD
jgi:hypothetical protein